MLTKKDILEIGELLKPLQNQVEGINIRVQALDKKIERIDSRLEVTHAEIMEKLVESNEIHSEEIKKLDKRITSLEKEIHLVNN